MVELDQFRYRISGYDKPMAQIKNSLDLDNKQKRIEELPLQDIRSISERILPACRRRRLSRLYSRVYRL